MMGPPYDHIAVMRMRSQTNMRCGPLHPAIRALATARMTGLASQSRPEPGGDGPRGRVEQPGTLAVWQPEIDRQGDSLFGVASSGSQVVGDLAFLASDRSPGPGSPGLDRLPGWGGGARARVVRVLIPKKKDWGRGSEPLHTSINHNIFEGFDFLDQQLGSCGS